METTNQPARRRGRPRKTLNLDGGVANKSATTKSHEFASQAKDEFPAVDERKVGVDEVFSSASENSGLGSVSDFNPLSEAVEQREYSSPKIATGVTEEIDEPSFHQPSYQELSGDQNAEEKGGGVWNPIEDGNPALEDLPDKEKSAAVKTMVSAVLDMYDGAHIIAQRVVQMPEQKLIEMHNEGSINIHQRIPVGAAGDDMNVLELTQAFNQQAAEALEPSEDFRKKVTPPMTRIFMKRGWGMTDEQALLLYFGQDIASKAILVYSLKAQLNQILKLVSTDSEVQSKASRTRAENAAKAEIIEEDDVKAEEDSMRASAVSDDIEDVADDDGMVSTKMTINNEENPLRVNTRRKPKAPRVTSKFVKGKKA